MNIQRVLLIVPPAITFRGARDINPLPPIGLGYLASVVENMGIEVRILDCLLRGWNLEKHVAEDIVLVGLSNENIRKHITDFDPDLIGVSCSFSRQYKIYHDLFSLIKNLDQRYLVVAGGAHVTVCPDEILNDPNCDFILLGEAEESFRQLLFCLMNNSDLSHIDGLGWKSNGKLCINEKTNFIRDLDAIPFPAYHKMNLEDYFGLNASHGLRHKRRFSPIVTSRGCPAQCTFCSANKVWGKKYRTRSVDNVLKEMKLLKSQYGVEEIMFEDDNVTADPKRAKKLFSNMIEDGLNFIWDTPNGVGVWSVDEEMIDLMKKSGCIRLNFPIESGSQYVLDHVIRKPINLSKVKKLIDYCRKVRLDYGIFLVIGMPGERIDDIWKSFRFAADCRCYSPHISVATPYPGTVLFDDCLENNYFSRRFLLDDLFIRSFLVKTPDWSEKDLERTILKGKIYLIIRNLVNQPVTGFKRIVAKLRNPRQTLRLFDKFL